MIEQKTWENLYFGKKGRFFPVAYVIPVPILAMAVVLLAFSFADGFHAWERIVIFGIGILFLAYFCRSLEAIAIFHSTIREVTIKRDTFCLKTFGGKTIEEKQFATIEEDCILHKKRNTQFLFPESPRSLVIKFNSKRYFLPSSINDFCALRERLFLASRGGEANNASGQ